MPSSMAVSDLDPRAHAALDAELARDGDALADVLRALGALDSHVACLDAPADAARPVVLPSYGGSLHVTNLTPALALLLRRYGVPVLVHGCAAIGGGDATRAVLAVLGIPAAADAADAQSHLDHDAFAYVELSALAPALARRMSRGTRPTARTRMLAGLIDPFRGRGYRVVAAAGGEELATARAVLAATRANALLLAGADGEPFVDPRRPSPLEHFDGGAPSTCDDALHVPAEPAQALPPRDASATAQWTARVLDGETPIPAALLTELGCCLAGSRDAR
jgi:anthranilate phosphoribosyltransferase